MTDVHLLPPGTQIDLDNCAREPIHVPGSIQPRGVLLVVEEPAMTVQHVSVNVDALLGHRPDRLLGAGLAAAIGAEAADVLARAAASFSDLRARNPIELAIPVDGEVRSFDAILHREPDNKMLVELEPAHGPRPFSFPNTYLAVRGAVGELNRAATLQELYEITAGSVRELTGFDRVMVYRYDADYNGEVVAEARREDLNSFLGLHYPATDIPAQARALYEKNWVRLISDVDYVPAAILPGLDPRTGAPLDLTYATLRSVSPIHVEYLQNMGVGASMSISLLRDGRLWGLIACHHYSGAHTPPYGTRAAAEFLGSALSLRLVARSEEEALREQVRTQAVLGALGTAMLGNSVPLARTVLDGMSELVAADGCVVRLDGQREQRGSVPDAAVVEALAGQAAAAEAPMLVLEALHGAVPGTAVPPEVASGALVLALPDGQFVAWFRVEEARTVDWGGDPGNKAIAVREGDTVRLSPRKSFERWRESVSGRCRPWDEAERAATGQLRARVLDALYERARDELRMAERLQRSLLPQLPRIPGWEITARYEPAAGGQIGGDWYDAFTVADGSLATVLGDVAGHGIEAAGTMAQLRNVLRAHLYEGCSPAEALARTNAFAVAQLGHVFATSLVACIEPETGEVRIASAGHPRPFLRSGPSVRTVPVPISPPIGVRDARFVADSFRLERSESILLFSDGMVERRDRGIDVGLAKLAAALGAPGLHTADELWEHVHDDQAADDATVLKLRRE